MPSGFAGDIAERGLLLTRRGLQLASLAAVFVALATTVWITDESRTEGGDPITELVPDAVSRIVLQGRRRRTQTVLVRAGADWRMTGPIEIAANPVRARQLAALAGARAIRSYSIAAVSLKALSLEPALARVTLDDTVIDFGGTEPLERLRYVRVGERMHLIEDGVFRQLEGGAERFVDPSLLGPRPRLDGLDLPDLKIRRTTSGWHWSPQVPARSADDITALVAAWEAAGAISVEPLDLGQRWSATITVRLADDSEIVFVTALQNDTILFARRDVAVQFRLPARRGQRLLRIEASADGDQPES